MDKTSISNQNNDILKGLHSSKITEKPKSNDFLNQEVSIKTFSPLQNILYCYFIEQNKILPNQLDTNIQTTFGINDEIDYVVDIQHFCYYPGTKNIYTFLGCSDQIHLNMSIKHLLSQKLILDNKVELYSENNKDQIYENVKEIKHPLYTDIKYKNSQSDIENSDKINTQTSNIQENSPECFSDDTSNLSIQEFQPLDNKYYCYFAEIQNPIKDLINQSERITNLYGVYAFDIKRFCYYPNTHKIFTFLGFSDLYHVSSAIHNETLKSNAVDNTIYLYQFTSNMQKELENINNEVYNLKETKEFKTFVPKKNLFYCYFIPKEIIYLTDKNFKKPYKLNYASDIQFNCYYPGTNSIYIFLGFSSTQLLKKAINQPLLQSASYNNKIEVYKNDNNKIVEQSTNKNDKPIKTNNFTKLDLTILMFIDCFIPVNNLVYCFFDEKTKPDNCITSQHYKNIQYNNIYIEDMQRFYYSTEKHSAYSFFGFHTEEELFEFINDPTIKSLAENENFFIYFKNTIVNYKRDLINQGINKENTNYQIISIENKSLMHEFKAMKDLVYVYFVEKKKINSKRLNERSNSIKEIKKPIDIQRYSFYPNTHEVYSFFGFDKIDILLQNIENLIKNGYSINEINIYHDNLTNISNKLYPFYINKLENFVIQKDSNNNDQNNQLKVNNFSPKENIFYVYFQESKKIKPSLKPLLTKSFDIQKRCYYPGSNDIYSFYGFKSRKYVDNLINDESLRSKMQDIQFYIYFKASIKLKETKSLKMKKEFNYNENLIYIYLKENEVEEGNELKNIKDVQRFCYYPGTENIYSFYGYSNKKDIINSVQNSKLKINEIINIKLYSKDDIDNCTNLIAVSENFEEKMIQNFKKPKKPYSVKDANKTKIIINDSKEIKNENNYNSIDSNQKPSIMTNKSNHKTSILGEESHNKIKNINKDENNQKQNLAVLLFIDCFIPVNNLVYCFFDEKTKPDNCITSQHYQNIHYNDFYIEDIQRFYYLTEKHSTYSFFGFHTEEELFKFINDPTIKSLATNEVIYTYSNKLKPKSDDELITNKRIAHDCDVDDDIIQEFKPKKRTFYIYFNEKKKPNPSKMKYRNRSIREIHHAYDAQRYSYYPNEKNIYSFFGFSTIRQLKSNIENPKLVLASLTGKIYFYTDNVKLDQKSKCLSNLLDILYQNNVTLFRDDRLKSYHSNYESNDDSNENNLKLNEFTPKENIFYVYFQEILKSDLKGYLQISNLSKYMKFAVDVQRYYFLPGSNDIYSFLGFKNIKYVENIINDHSLRIELGERQIHIYFKCLTNQNKTHVNKEKCNEFAYNENLIYIYLKENNEKEEMIKSKNIKDIQRNCYYPGTKEIYSFYGFSSKHDIIASITNSRVKINDILSMKIYYKDKKIDQSFHINMITITENFEEKIILENQLDLNKNSFQESPIQKKNADSENENEINNSNNSEIRHDFPKFNNYENNDLLFKTFDPCENLFYCFLAEKINPNNRILNEKNKKIYQINSATDVQRFHYYPSTKNIYTFIGFSTKDLLNSAMKKSTLKSAAVNQSIYQYPFDINQNVIKHQQNTFNKEFQPEKKLIPDDSSNDFQPKIQLSEEKSNENSTQLMTQFKPIIIEFKPLIFNPKRNQKDKIFTPDEDLYYIYFLEKNSSERNIHLQNTELFGIKNINDLQRGYKLNEKDPNYYTFFGFIQSINCIISINTLSKNEEIIQSSIKRIDNDDDSSEYDDDEISEINNKKSININKITSKSDNIEKSDKNENISNKQSINKEINTKFYYKPVSNESTENTDKSFDNSDNFNKTKNACNAFKSPKLNNNGLSFKEFIPDNKLKYLFFSELNEPNYRIINQKYKKLFGIQFASDIQRFRYYPNTDKVFTFIGFSNQNQLNQAYRTTSLKSSSVNKNIYFYPDKNISINETLSNSSIQQNEPNPNSSIQQDGSISNSAIQQNEHNSIKNDKLGLFHPKDDLFYVYFKEKNCTVYNHEENFCSLFEISNIQNLQRGFRINENGSECYTFLGFLKSIDANSAMSTLFQNKKIDTLSIKKFLDDNDDDEYSSISSSYKDESMIDYEYENDEELNLLFYSKEILPIEKIHFKNE